MGLIPEIKQKIDDWLNAEPGRSISSLATLAGIHYSTARRILQNENLPTYSTLAAILTVVDKEANLKELLLRQYPKEKTLISAFRKNQIDLSLFHGLDSLSTHILAFLTNSRDSSSIEIASEFGKAGLNSVETLLARGLIENQDGILKPMMGDICLTTVFDVLNMVTSHATHTNQKNIQNNMGLAGMLWNCTSVEGYKKILKVSEETIAAINMIMNENPGSLPIYTTCVVNSYLSLSNGEIKETNP